MREFQKAKEVADMLLKFTKKREEIQHKFMLLDSSVYDYL